MKKIILLALILSFTMHSFAQKVDSTKTPTITLRGLTPTSTEPLIVIDGNKQYARGAASLGGMDPNNIESINVIKDGASITKYGSDGMAGVIEIKTKNGLAGIYNKPIDTGDLNLKGKIYGLSVRPSNNTVNRYYKTKPDTPIKRFLLLMGTDPIAKPIYVLNGKEVASIDHLDPKTIESIEVLKDASSTTLYGDKGKNGTVIITTKTSKKAFQKKN